MGHQLTKDLVWVGDRARCALDSIPTSWIDSVKIVLQSIATSVAHECKLNAIFFLLSKFTGGAIKKPKDIVALVGLIGLQLWEFFTSK